MSATTEISWTDSTFNPWIGCQHVSPGCDHCYAEFQNAYRKWSADGAWGPHAERRRTSASNWKNPLRWNADGPRFEREHGRRRRVFCASLADWLDNQADPKWRADLCELIEQTPALDWQLLTKRIENYRKLVPAHWREHPPANVWLGATMESAKYYRARWPILARISARVRFVSYEPAIDTLGPLDLGDDCGVPDWIITGGESGPKARTMNPQWARDVRDQCQAHGVAFFLKQHGSYRSNPFVFEQGMSLRETEVADPRSNGKGGALLDSRLYRQFPDAQRVTQRAVA